MSRLVALSGGRKAPIGRIAIARQDAMDLREAVGRDAENLD
jgi:hypothetical protein